ncbi:MAG: lytic transglycosylase domain-containing protein [Burkholderiales bacterium]|nr:lytic transglycosylase domain-containing protein [Burkholderiales bacterium]
MPSARAEVWGYIDEQGRPHVATSKLDDRYQLFFKGRSSADVPLPNARDIAAGEAFERTAIFRRVEGHPNVKRFAPLIERYAALHEVDPALVKAMVAVESAYDPDAVSAKGALGLMQVIPETGERYGVTGNAKRSVADQLFDPAINLRVGTRYLSDLLALFDNDIALALAAYNAGENVVRHYENRVPPFPETQEFVKLVQKFYALYRPPPPPPAASSRITIPRQPASMR